MIFYLPAAILIGLLNGLNSLFEKANNSMSGQNDKAPQAEVAPASKNAAKPAPKDAAKPAVKENAKPAAKPESKPKPPKKNAEAGPDDLNALLDL